MGKLDKTKLYEPKKNKKKVVEEDEATGSALPKACVNCTFYNPYKTILGKKYCNYYKTYCCKITSHGCSHYIPYK